MKVCSYPWFTESYYWAWLWVWQGCYVGVQMWINHPKALDIHTKRFITLSPSLQFPTKGIQLPSYLNHLLLDSFLSTYNVCVMLSISIFLPYVTFLTMTTRINPVSLKSLFVTKCISFIIPKLFKIFYNFFSLLANVIPHRFALMIFKKKEKDRF